MYAWSRKRNKRSYREALQSRYERGKMKFFPQYESLARSLLPVIQKYYESDEGKRAFAEWKEKKKAAEKSATEA